MQSASVEFFSSPGPLTDLRGHESLLAGLPSDPGALCRMIQGLLVHVFWADRYGTTVTEDRAAALGHRSAGWKLERILELDARPLSEPRPVADRLVANCRDYTLMLTALLRHLGIPARARCGFATYFTPNWYEDHWVGEYFDRARGRWVLVDAQLDELQRGALAIDFDPLDVPRDRFLVAGRAWQLCRGGAAEPGCFGIQDMHGLWFVRGDLVRDVAALQKLETLPWDCWGLVDGMEDELPEAETAVLNRAAALSALEDPDTVALDALYAGTPGLQVPPELLA